MPPHFFFNNQKKYMKRKPSMEELKLYIYKDEYIRYYNNYCYCGEPGEIGQEPEEWVPASDVLEADGVSSYIAEIFGDSMVEADIRPGDKVVIDKTRTPQVHDIVLAMVDGKYTLKFYATDQDGNAWLVPANERYMPMMLDLSQESNRIVGVMSSLIRRRPAFDTVLAKRLDKAYEKYKMVRLDEDVDKPFYKYIPNDKDKKKVTERLHNLLDGQEGVAVIKILRSAVNVGYLSRIPTKGDVEKEFSVTVAHSVFYKSKNTEYPITELETYMESLLA